MLAQRRTYVRICDIKWHIPIKGPDCSSYSWLYTNTNSASIWLYIVYFYSYLKLYILHTAVSVIYMPPVLAWEKPTTYSYEVVLIYCMPPISLIPTSVSSVLKMRAQTQKHIGVERREERGVKKMVLRGEKREFLTIGTV